jgi:uncharacterized membrane protein YphA (DoxX/SURF4 family)
MKIRRVWYIAIGIGRVFAGVVFVAAGFGKLKDGAAAIILGKYISAVTGMNLPVDPVLSQYLPAIELGLGAFLVCGMFIRLHACAGMLLLCGFAVFLSIGWARGIDIASCTCFGRFEGSATYAELILRDSALALVLLPSVLGAGRWASVDGLLAADRVRADRMPGLGVVLWLTLPLVVCTTLVLARGNLVDAAPPNEDRGVQRLELEVRDSNDEGVAGCRVRIEGGEDLGTTGRAGRLDCALSGVGVRFLVIAAPASRPELGARRVVLPHVVGKDPGGKSLYRLLVRMSPQATTEVQR